uniref:AMP-dependent synthetase/ligase domain-containing protein n=1 Tax=Spongospora subterranea TaxID=70186 RepID=A0A0H5R5M1_9EUKA|eukprot:CRZ09077.1 hypothetical protein [Spongospora subterranea]
MGAGPSAFNYEDELKKDKILQSCSVGYGGDNVDKEAVSEIRRAIGFEKNLMKFPFENSPNEVRSMWQAVSQAAKRFPSKECFGTRVFDDISNGAYKWQTFSQVHDQAVAVGSGLVARGLSAEMNIGIFAPNRAEWMISAYGAYSQRMRVVALYATLGPQAVEFIVNHAELTTLFVAKENLAEVLGIASSTKINLIIQFDVNEEAYGNTSDIVDEEQKTKAAAAGIKLITLSALIAEGILANVAPSPPTEDDVAYIMYTSGTTGQPKGAIMTHGNVLSGVPGIEHYVRVHETDTHFCFLPLAHIFETDAQVVMMLMGGRVGFWQGNIKKLTDDLCALRPTIMMAVPRVLSRIYQTIMGGVTDSSCVKRSIFRHAYSTQLANVRNRSARSGFFDSKIFNPIASRVGLDKCRLIVSGAAPLPPYLMEFLRVIFNCVVVQGYGLTETSAALSITNPVDFTSGHVGPPVPCVEVRLRSIPEMNYKVTDPLPRGEISLRGPNVFKGYLHNEKITKESFDEDGFYLTGDIGRFNANGTISVIDRKKNIFKLSQGEYVASEHVEAVYSKCPMISQVWVYGNSFKSFVLAVVVPSAERIISYGKDQGWYDGPAFGREGFPEAFAKMCEKHYDEIKKVVKTSMSEQEGLLKGFEKAKDIVLEFNVNLSGLGFTEQNECMTPTFKLRSAFLLKRYRQQLRDLYSKNGEAPLPDEKWPGE